MSIASKLLAAQIAVGAAAKDARNDHHRFNYATADSIVAIAKDALNAAGLMLVNTRWKIHGEPVTFSFGERDTHISGLTITAEFVLLDSESEEKLELSCELPYVPGKGRPVDKAALASLTEMRGYLALGLLGIERVDKDDVSGRDDTPLPYQANNNQQQHEEQYDDNVCEKCGSAKKYSEKSGNWYCGAMCWKNQPKQQNGQRQYSGNGRDY